MTLLDEPCSCGSAHRRVVEVEGRLDDGFEYNSTRVHGHVFRSRLGKERHIVEYQVRQTAGGALVDVRCSGHVDLASLRDALVRDLTKAGLSSPEVEVTPVERIERPRSGKLKRFIPFNR